MTRQITIDTTQTEGFAARIKNRGGSQGTQTVELYKDGTLVTDNASLTLTPDESAYVLEAPSVFSNAFNGQTLTMEVVTADMTRTVEVLIDVISDSVHQYPAYEGSGTTLNDEVGSIDATLTADVFESNNDGVGGFVLDFANNTGESATLDSVPSEIAFNSDSQYSVAFTANADNISNSNTDKYLYRHFDSTDSNFCVFGTGDGADIGLQIRDDVSGTKKDELNSVGSILGSISGLTRFLFTVDTVNVTSKIYINGNQEGDGSAGVKTNDTTDSNPSLNGGASLNTQMDNWIFYDKILTDSEAQKDYNRQPIS